jgi:DNA polymerase III epsilon subunit-like protein
MFMSSYFRNSTSESAQELLNKKPVYLDTETTGIGANAEIVEISIVDADGEVLVDTLVKPHRRIPMDAVRIHGITDQMVQSAPSWMLVWPNVEKILHDRVVGIYNAEFDLRMMRQNNQLYELVWRYPARKVFCIMKMYAEFYGSGRWQTLENAGLQCGIPLPNSHRALDDTKLAREVFLYMAEYTR